MAIQLDSFVDAHCHMFTAADVPLHATISNNIHHPLVLLFGGLFAGLNFKSYEKFIKFFDHESETNVDQVVDELDLALNGVQQNAFRIDAAERILTPLIMDFDRNGGVNKFEGQVRRLKKAAQGCQKANVKVLPFIGLDPRRQAFDKETGALKSPAQARSAVIAFLKDYGAIDKAADQRQARATLDSGDMLGVKIYPPLGFNVYPDDPAERSAFLAIYEALAEYQVPATVHCQRGSYNLAAGNMAAFTTPENWAKVLGTNSTLAKLRINFGHFGGEREVAQAVNWSDGGSDDASSYFATGVSHVGWSTEIIKLLKRYENTYADLSAFDYRIDESAASLLWLLAYDKAGKFDEGNSPNFALVDKLLWGSDYPMILDKDYTSYQTYLSGFINAVIDRELIRQNNMYQIPEDAELPLSAVDLLKVLVGDNPVKFLFG